MSRPLPRRLLAEDEEVVLALHPHWRRLVVPALSVPVVVGVASYLVFLVPSGGVSDPLRWLVVGVAALVLLRVSVWPWLRWRSTHYVLTNRRLLLRAGVLGRAGRDVPLGRITDVSFRRSVVERLMRCGTLTVESGGEEGRIVLPDVPSVELVHHEVYRLVDAQAGWPGRWARGGGRPSGDWFWDDG